jgi:CRISPR-associated protein Cas2
MYYLVSYDIADNKQRGRAAKILDDYGSRVQKSVFEIAGLSDEMWKNCLARLNKYVKLGDEDSIRIYLLCETCRGKVQVIGKGPAPMESPDVIII